MFFTGIAINDLRYVVRAMYPLAEKWKEIGQTLGVRNLEATEKKFQGDPERCWIAMLGDWLHEQYDKHVNPDLPSWWKVVWVTVDPQGGDKLQRARFIANNYRGEFV